MKLGIISILGLLLLLVTAQPALGQTVFEGNAEITVNVNNRGVAHVQIVGQYAPSALADVLKISAAQDLEGTKTHITSGAQSDLAVEEYKITNSRCEINGLGEGENFAFTVEFDVESYAVFNSSDNAWIITPSWTAEMAQKEVNSIKAVQNSIRSLASDAQYQTTGVMNVILPEGAQIANGDELENKTIYDNYGVGSYSRDTYRTGTANGRAAVIKEYEMLLLASTEITITSEELGSAHSGFQIKYTGVPPPPGPDYLLYVGIGVAVVAILAAIILVKRRSGGLPKTPSDKGWAF